MLQCLACKCTFLYAAKRTLYDLNNLPYKIAAEQVYIHPADNVIVAKTDISVCPYCFSREIAEYTMPLESIRSIDINEADALLKEGYVLKDAFAKTVTLIKPKEAKKE